MTVVPSLGLFRKRFPYRIRTNRPIVCYDAQAIHDAILPPHRWQLLVHEETIPEVSREPPFLV